jgi:hypothetical protein
MGASQVPAIGGSLNNWELISTASTGGASTLSFTSISGYQSLKVVWSSTAFNDLLSYARINADSGNNYAYSGTTGSTNVGTNTFTSRAIATQTYQTFEWTILNCNNSNLKTYAVNSFDSSNVSLNATGFYLASAAVTSLDFAWSSGITGTVRLYGVKA